MSTKLEKPRDQSILYKGVIWGFSYVTLWWIRSNISLSKNFFYFFLTICYHFHLKNIKLLYLLYLTCNLRLFRSKIKSYLSWRINYPQFINGKCRPTNMIFSYYRISFEFCSAPSNFCSRPAAMPNLPLR